MDKTEMMKRYEAETGECATWTWHEREFLTDDYIDTINIEFLAKENKMLREEGMRLAEASMRVIRTYDGLHRLGKAVSRWCDAIAGEGGRKERYEGEIDDYFANRKHDYIAWLEAQLRWRPVSEKPDKGQRVLYFGGTVDIGEYNGYEEWIDTDGGICPVELTSHWLPIPPAPEGE